MKIAMTTLLITAVSAGILSGCKEADSKSVGGGVSSLMPSSGPGTSCVGYGDALIEHLVMQKQFLIGAEELKARSEKEGKDLTAQGAKETPKLAEPAVALKGLGCAPGAVVWSKEPHKWCDFSKSIAFNQYNSAVCILASDAPRNYVGAKDMDKLKEYLKENP